MKKLNLYALFTLFLCLCVASGNAQNLENIGQQKPVHISSGLSLSSSYYHAIGTEDRQAPFAWTLSGSPTLEVYGFSMPFTFFVTNQNRGYQQPFNQFGVTPQYKWVKVHLGYSAVNFSQFTMAGRRFLGAGVELTPSKWRIGFVQGRFQKAITYDSIASSATAQYPSVVPVPSFSRSGYAARIGVGGKKASIDVSYLKAGDDKTSIVLTDSLANILRPQENAVVGVQGQLTFFKKLTLAADIGISAYSRDVRSDSITLPERFAFMSKFLMPRLSTQVQTAGESSLGYRDKHFSMRVLYRRIDPDFKSMGAFFFQNDMEQWLVTPSVNVLKNRLQISGSYGWQHNNISATRNRTTDRTIGSANLSFQDGNHFSLQATFSNYGITMQPRKSIAPTNLLDTFRLSQINQAISISPNWSFVSETKQQNFGISANYNALNDLQAASAYQSNMKTLSGNAYYSVNLPKKKLGLNMSLIYQNLDNAIAKNQSLGINAGVNKTLAKDKMTVGSNVGWYSGNSGNTLQIGGNLSYTIAKNGSFFLNARWQQTTTGEATSTNWSEFFGSTGVSFNF